MRILILDDRPDRSGVLVTNLRADGFTVITFTSPQEALKHIHEADVLITDHHVHKMTGLEIARQAYALGWRGSFLLMSGDLVENLQKLSEPS